MDIISDGDLFRMQQEAIERARETARLAQSNPQETKPENKGGFSLKRIIDSMNFKSNDSLILIGVLLLLLSDGCEDELLILALIFLLIKN